MLLLALLALLALLVGLEHLNEVKVALAVFLAVLALGEGVHSLIAAVEVAVFAPLTSLALIFAPVLLLRLRRLQRRKRDGKRGVTPTPPSRSLTAGPLPTSYSGPKSMLKNSSSMPGCSSSLLSPSAPSRPCSYSQHQVCQTSAPPAPSAQERTNHLHQTNLSAFLAHGLALQEKQEKRRLCWLAMRQNCARWVVDSPARTNLFSSLGLCCELLFKAVPAQWEGADRVL